MDKKDYSLTPKQQEAFDELEKAFKKCCKLGVIVWDWYGKISAVNGKVVSYIEVGGDPNKEPIDVGLVAQFRPKCLHGGMADDEIETRVVYRDE